MRTRHVMLSALMLIVLMAGTPKSAHSQVVVIVGNGSAQPYYAQPSYPYSPYPSPYPYQTNVLYNYYPAYGYPGYYAGYYNSYFPRYGYWGW